MVIRILLLSLLCGFCSVAFSQPEQQHHYQQGAGHQPGAEGQHALSLQQPQPTAPGAIRGHVLDSKTKQPVEYATATLYNEADNKIVSGGITNDKGKFDITNVPFGSYYMTVSFIGLTADTVRGLVITQEKPEIKLDDVFMHSSEVSLNQVTVTGQKELLEYNLDKKIINVDKDVTAAGSSALEVMKNVPSVTVDIDGNVSLRGSNANILIDGKPSSMPTPVLLEQLPADMVDHIEIVTNPSARYEAEGTSGIINIVTKKNKQQGLNGIVNASIGTKNKYMAGANLNYRNKKVNYFLGLNGSYNQRTSEGTSYREYHSGDTLGTLNYLNQESDGLRKMQNYNVKAGTDISFNDQTSLSLTGNLRYGLSDDDEDNDYQTTDSNATVEELYTRNSDEDDNNLNYDFAGGFKKTYKTKGKEWTIDGSYSSSQSDEDMQGMQRFIVPSTTPDEQDRTTTDEHNQVATLQSDFVLPVEKIGRFEMGVRGSYRNTDNDLVFEDYDGTMNDWVNDNGKSNRFQYEEAVFAGYIVYGNKYKNFSYQGGLRYEGTLMNTYQVVTDDRFVNNYHNLFPSVHLRYSFKKDNELSLSYSERISRPNMWVLNPFPEYSDPLSLRVGNPELRPEIIHSVELGHSKVWKKLSLTSTLFYRNTQDVIMRYATVDSNGVATVTSLNLSKSHSFGAEFVFNMNLFKWWRWNSNFSYYRQIVEGREDLGIEGSDNYNFTGRLSTTFTVWKNMDIQVSGFFRSKALNAQGYMLPMYSMDMGVKKDVLKGKGSVSLSATDVFNTRRFRVVTEDVNYYAETMRRRESQILTLGFTYKIGNSNANNRKDKKKTDDTPGGGDMDYDGN